MELTDLRHFSHVAVTASFSRGAALSHVSAPAVSKSIRKLEDELGARLFERTTRKVALTAAGRALLTRTERIFAELDALRAELDGDEDAAVAGEIRLAANEVLSVELLPRALASLRARHPDLHSMTYEMVPDVMQTALREGRIEIGLTIGGRASAGIDAIELGRSDGVLVCGRGHPLYGHRRVGKRQVVEHPSVVPRFLGFEHVASLDQFPDDVWPRSIGATIELLQMAVRLCEEGAYLGYFPALSVRAQLADGRLAKLGGLPPRPPFVLHALVRAGATMRPAAKALLDELGALVRSTMD